MPWDMTNNCHCGTFSKFQSVTILKLSEILDHAEGNLKFMFEFWQNCNIYVSWNLKIKPYKKKGFKKYFRD